MYFYVLFVFKIDIKFSSVDSIHSVLLQSQFYFRISVLDFCYFIPFVCIKQSEVNLFMIIRHRHMQMSIDINNDNTHDNYYDFLVGALCL